MSDLEPDWVAKFRQAILDLDEAVSDYRTTTVTLDDACGALVALNIAKREIGIVYDALVTFVSDLMDQQAEINLPDGSRVEKKWAAERRGWKHKDLGAAVAKRILDLSIDMDTGEIVLTEQERIAMLLDFVQPSYWRVKELNKIGVNADLFCEVGETKSSIIVRKAS